MRSTADEVRYPWVDATPAKPFCFSDERWFNHCSSCAGCVWALVCGPRIHGAGYFRRPRKSFVEAIARSNLPRGESIDAIVRAYSVTYNAARKQYDRWRKKLGNPQ